MIGCNEQCIVNSCCDFCIWVHHKRLEIEGVFITTNPDFCTLHEDARHQDLVLSNGACNDFHCFNANKELNKWIEADICDT